jgi:ferredoxin-thioredoxin reductase catalytic subunit
MVRENNQHINTVNKFVLAFLSNIQEESNAVESWKEKKNQKKLKATFNKIEENHVKRPKSKYIFFCEYVRNEIREEFPDMNIRDVTCELGKRWQEYKLNPDQEMEKKIIEAFEKDKERYNSQKKPVEVKNKNVFRSMYLYFCDQERKKNPTIEMKELGEKWNNIKNDKNQYEKITKMYMKKKMEEKDCPEEKE